MKRKIILIGLLLGLGLLYAGSRIRVVELGYEVSKLEEECRNLQRENGVLKSEVARKTSTSELVRWAQQLQMTPPKEGAVVFLRE